MLSSGQLSRMRTTAERALPDVCKVQRKTAVSDGGGGSNPTWADHLLDVPCRISPVAGGEAGTTGDRISDEATAVVTVAAYTDVTAEDRFVIYEQIFEVKLVRRRGAWALTQRCEVTEAP